MISFSLVERYQCFWGICCVHLQGRRVSHGGENEVADIGKWQDMGAVAPLKWISILTSYKLHTSIWMWVKNKSLISNNPKYIKMELLWFLLPTPGLMNNTQGYYEIYCTLLPVCKVAMGVKAKCRYCSRVLSCDLSLHSTFFLIT